MIEEAVAQAMETNHLPTLVNTHFNKANFEIVRGDAGAAQRDAEIVVKLARENALALYASWGALQSAWAGARLDGRESATTELQEAMVTIIDQGIKAFVPFFHGLLAEIDAQSDAAVALTRIDQALVLAGETGEHWSDAFLHRLRGKTMLERDPSDVAGAEDALLAAVAIARQQEARSFELRAALDLARLYNSTGRPVDASTLLTAALKGFSPTPEFPEIAAANTLLTALAQ